MEQLGRDYEAVAEGTGSLVEIAGAGNEGKSGLVGVPNHRHLRRKNGTNGRHPVGKNAFGSVDLDVLTGRPCPRRRPWKRCSRGREASGTRDW